MKASPTTAHFIPYASSNPYQLLLTTELERRNLQIAKNSDLATLIRTAGPDDLVHLHWLPTVHTRFRGLLSVIRFVRNLSRLREKRVPIVWTAHNLLPHESNFPALDLWISRQVARLADRIICHSEAARQEVLDRLAPPCSSKMCVIPHGHYIGTYPGSRSSAACRNELDLESDAVVILFLGLIRRYKGVVELIDAFRRIGSPKNRLVIAGKVHPKELDKEIQTRIAGDARITYRAGFVADDEMQIYLNAADVVVFPYQKSLTSGALILAMSYSRACIAPRLPSMVECLTETGGLFYEPSVPDALYETLSEAIRRQHELSAMGARNLERAKAWDWGTIAQATLACYEDAKLASHERS